MLARRGTRDLRGIGAADGAPNGRSLSSSFASRIIRLSGIDKGWWHWVDFGLLCNAGSAAGRGCFEPCSRRLQPGWIVDQTADVTSMGRGPDIVAVATAATAAITAMTGVATTTGDRVGIAPLKMISSEVVPLAA
jgi:hypothetical protein